MTGNDRDATGIVGDVGCELLDALTATDGATDGAEPAPPSPDPAGAPA